MYKRQSKYFRIGEKKLRKLAEENIDAGWVIVNGNRIQIKRDVYKRQVKKQSNVYLYGEFADTSHFNATKVVIAC